MAIEGKVAAIVNERDLVINRGSGAGVEEGMKFKVVEAELAIKDPDTGEALGTFDREKIRVRIVEVHPKYSIGKTYETYVVNVGGAFPDFADVFRRMATPRQEVTKVRTLRADDTTILEPMNEASSIVKVGDMVVEVEEESRVTN